MDSKLRAFINAMPDDNVRRRFAERCETSLGHLKNVMYGLRPCAPDLAVSIERESGRSVTRRDLRDDWHRFWPELIKAQSQPLGPLDSMEVSSVRQTALRPRQETP